MKQESGGLELAGYKIALLESNAVNLEQTGELLRSWGCDVVPFYGVGHAMGVLAGHAIEPDLLICDLRLDEDMNGFEAIDMIRRKLSSGSTVLPALLMTGDVGMEAHPLASDDSVRVIYKPVRPSQFKAILMECRAQASAQARPE